ncbi:hypothetical protein FS749_008676 [Ceratobasidium sp. UAMH 11750]|nr:hypothetical protein FS749_008676 [Ceratobasidium sp. UAMH 11750]
MTPPAEKLVHRFLPNENTFLHRVSPDHILHASTADSNMPEFLDRLVDEFFNRFPYRHVRLAEHFEHTQEEDSECLYGRALWGFPEKLWHKMNDIKNREKKGKEKGKKPPPKPSGEIDVEETTAYWRKRLARVMTPLREDPFFLSPVCEPQSHATGHMTLALTAALMTSLTQVGAATSLSRIAAPSPH